MPDRDDGADVRLDGAHLQVDARPARLVAQLRGDGGAPVVTAQPLKGRARTELVPAAARRVTFQVEGDLSVEAVRGADFVALVTDDGRRLVVAFTGEVTVLPAGRGGDRFALRAHEALLILRDGADPKVLTVAALSSEDEAKLTSVVEAAAEAILAPAMAATTSQPSAVAPPGGPVAAEAPAQPPRAVPLSATAPATEPPHKKAPPHKKGPPPARAAGGGKKRKKGKGRPQPGKKASARPPTTAGATGAAAAVNKRPPQQKAGGGASNGDTPPPTGGGRGDGEGRHEEAPRDWRLLVASLLLTVVGGLAVTLFLLTGRSGTSVDTAAPGTTRPGAPVTAATPTTGAAEPTTTAATATTRPAGATTAPAAPAPKYEIEPKTCVQRGASVTYTASITNAAPHPFDYTIGVVFKDGAGKKIANATADISRVAPNRPTDFTATATAKSAPATCDVETVDARPSR